MRIYRISKPEYVSQALSGIGAAMAAGRWNSSGVRIAYTAQSAALAILEILVHVDKSEVPHGLRLLSYEIDTKKIETLSTLPRAWKQLPYSASVRHAGDRWIKAGSSLALRVPSAVAPHEFNILINPLHDAVDAISLVADEELIFDERLIGGA